MLKTGPKPKPAIDRFFNKIFQEPNSGCWLWEGRLSVKGYGIFYLNTDGNGPSGRNAKPISAHRFSYENHCGIIPKHLELDHLCRTRCCVNPRHLEPVSHRENVRRGISPSGLNVDKAKCIRNHVLGGDNLYVDKRGNRHCKRCAADSMHRRWMRIKGAKNACASS